MPPLSDSGVSDLMSAVTLLVSLGSVRAAPFPAEERSRPPPRSRWSGRSLGLHGGRRLGERPDSRLVRPQSTLWGFFLRLLNAFRQYRPVVSLGLRYFGGPHCSSLPRVIFICRVAWPIVTCIIITRRTSLLESMCNTGDPCGLVVRSLRTLS